MSRSSKRSVTLIVSPTRSCNRNCAYCYVDERRKPPVRSVSIMREDTARCLFDEAGKTFDRPTVIWHGGEPSLAGVKFYERVLRFQQKETRNCVQTNGFCGDDILHAWKEKRFGVSTSLDLPLTANAITRRETQSEARRRMRKLISLFPHLGVITVVTRHNVKRPHVMLSWAKRLFWRANPVFSGADLAPAIGDLTAFLKWWTSRALLFGECAGMDPFAEFVKHVLVGRTTSCVFGRNCQERFLAVGPQGDIYPCNRYVGDAQYRLGNVRDGFEKALHSPVRQLFAERSTILRNSECKDCPWFSVCFGGCPVESGFQHRDPYCESYREVRSWLRSFLAENGVSFDDESKTSRIPEETLRRLPGLAAMLIDDRPRSGASFGSWNNDWNNDWRDCGPPPYSEYSQYSQHTDTNAHTDYHPHTDTRSHVDEYSYEDVGRYLDCLEKARLRAFFQPGLCTSSAVVLRRVVLANDAVPNYSQHGDHTDNIGDHYDYTQHADQN